MEFPDIVVISNTGSERFSDHDAPHWKPFFQLLNVRIPLMPVSWGEITNKNRLIVSSLLKLTNNPIQKYGMIILCMYD